MKDKRTKKTIQLLNGVRLYSQTFCYDRARQLCIDSGLNRKRWCSGCRAGILLVKVADQPVYQLSDAGENLVERAEIVHQLQEMGRQQSCYRLSSTTKRTLCE